MKQTSTYERVTYRPEGERARSIYLHRPLVLENDLGKPTFLTGVEVNREGDEVAGKGFDERRHLIDLELVIRRVPMRMDMYYGELVKDDTMIEEAPIGPTCECCGDELDLHIGGKPCTGGPEGSQPTYAERRAQVVRDQDRKRTVRLFGKDAI